MESISEPKNMLNALSHDLAHVIVQVSLSVVAVNARRHLSSSGVYWRDGIIVTAAHTIRRTDDISIILTCGRTVAADLAGVEPSTDLDLLKIGNAELSPPLFGD